MESKEEKLLKSDFFVVSDAGSTEVIGVYKNLDGNSNDDTLNYKMINREGRTFKLYRSPSEDQTVRYWVIEERNLDYFYLAFSDADTPPEDGWKPYIAGKGHPPYVTKVPRKVEYEIRTRLEHCDSFSTLDLINQYGQYCSTVALKRLYRVLWAEQTPETKEAAEKAKLAKSKRKRKKVPEIRQKITITVQLGLDCPNFLPTSKSGQEVLKGANTFELMVTFDTLVRLLMESISKQVTLKPGKKLELMVNGHEVLSKEVQINSLGIMKGSVVIALGVEAALSHNKNIAGNYNGVRKTAMPPLEEVEDQSKDKIASPVSSSEQTPASTSSCTIL